MAILSFSFVIVELTGGNSRYGTVLGCTTPSTSAPSSGSETATTTTVSPEQSIYLCRKVVSGISFNYCPNIQGWCYSSTDTKFTGYPTWQQCCYENNLFSNASFYNNTYYCHSAAYYVCTSGDANRSCVDFPLSCSAVNERKVFEISSYSDCCAAISSTTTTTTNGLRKCSNPDYAKHFFTCSTGPTTLDRSCYRSYKECTGSATPYRQGDAYHTIEDCCNAIGTTILAAQASCSNDNLPYHTLCTRTGVFQYCQSKQKDSSGATGCQPGDTASLPYTSFSQCCVAQGFTRRGIFPDTDATEYCHNTTYYACSRGSTHATCLDMPATCQSSPAATNRIQGSAYASWLECCAGILNVTFTPAVSGGLAGYCETPGKVCSYNLQSSAPLAATFPVCGNDIVCRGTNPLPLGAPVYYNDYQTCCLRNGFDVEDDTDTSLLPAATKLYCHKSSYYSCVSPNGIDKACYKLPMYCHTALRTRYGSEVYKTFSDCCTAIGTSSTTATYDAQRSLLLYCTKDDTPKYYKCRRAATSTSLQLDYCWNSAFATTVGACRGTDTPIAGTAYTAYSDCCDALGATKKSFFPGATPVEYCHSGLFFTCSSSNSATIYDRMCQDTPTYCPSSAPNRVSTGDGTFLDCCAKIINATAVLATTTSSASCSTSGNICRFTFTPTLGGASFTACGNSSANCGGSNPGFLDFNTCCYANNLLVQDSTDLQMLDVSRKYCHNSSYYACKLKSNNYDLACYREPMYCHSALRDQFNSVAYRTFSDCCTGIGATLGLTAVVVDAGQSNKVWCNNDAQNKYYVCKRASSANVQEMYYCSNKAAATSTGYCQGSHLVQAEAYASYSGCCTARGFTVKGTFASTNVEFCTNLAYSMCSTSATATDRICIDQPGLCNIGSRNYRFADTFTSFTACCQSATVVNSTYVASSGTTPAYCATNGTICSFAWRPADVPTISVPICANTPLMCSPLANGGRGKTAIRTYTDFTSCCVANNFTQLEYDSSDLITATSTQYCHNTPYLPCQMNALGNSLDLACYQRPSYCNTAKRVQVGSINYKTFADCCTGIGASPGPYIDDADLTGLATPVRVKFCNTDAQVKYYKCNRAGGSSPESTTFEYCFNATDGVDGYCRGTDTILASTVAYWTYEGCCYGNAYTKRSQFPRVLSPIEYCHKALYYSCRKTGTDDYARACVDEPLTCSSASPLADKSVATNYASFSDCCAGIKNTSYTPPTSTTRGYCTTTGNICSYSWTSNATNVPAFPVCMNEAASCASTNAPTNSYADFTTCCNANNFTQQQTKTLSPTSTLYCHASDFYVCQSAANLYDHYCYQQPHYCNIPVTTRVGTIGYKTFSDCCNAISATSGVLSDTNINLQFCTNNLTAKYYKCKRAASALGATPDLGEFSYCYNKPSDALTGAGSCYGSDALGGQAFVSYEACCRANSFMRKNVFPDIVEYCHAADFYACRSSSTGYDLSCIDQPATCTASSPNAPTQKTSTVYTSFAGCCEGIQNTSYTAVIASASLAYCQTDHNICSYTWMTGASGSDVNIDICEDAVTSCAATNTITGTYRDFDSCCDARVYGQVNTENTRCYNQTFYACIDDINDLDHYCYDQPRYCYSGYDTQDSTSSNVAFSSLYNSYADCCAGIKAGPSAYHADSGKYRCSTVDTLAKYYLFYLPATATTPEIYFCQNKSGTVSLNDARLNGASAELNDYAYSSYAYCCQDYSMENITSTSKDGIQYCHDSYYFPCINKGADAYTYTYYCDDAPSYCEGSDQRLNETTTVTYRECCTLIKATDYGNQPSGINTCYQMPNKYFPTPVSPATCGRTKYYNSGGNPGASIVNGYQALPNQYPWLVRMYPDATTYGHGVIVSPNFILSTYDLRSGGSCQIYAGDWRMSVANENANDYDSTGIAADNCIDDSTSGLSVTHIPTALSFSNWTIQRICLPADCSVCSPGRIGYISGWGSADPSVAADDMQYSIAAPIIDQAQCDAAYTGYSYPHLCTEFRSGKYLTSGADLGAPLMVMDRATGTFTLCGLAVDSGSATTPPHFVSTCSADAQAFYTANSISLTS